MFDKFLYIHTSLCMYFFLGAINDSFVWSNSDLKKLFDSGEFGDYLLVGEYLLFFVLCFCKYVSLLFCQLSLHVILLYACSGQRYSDLLYIYWTTIIESAVYVVKHGHLVDHICWSIHSLWVQHYPCFHTEYMYNISVVWKAAIVYRPQTRPINQVSCGTSIVA